MSQGNLEKFIIDLGFSDEKAVKGLKAFIAKVDKMKVTVKASVSGLEGAARKAGNSTTKAPQDSHISAFRKYQNKLDSIHTKAIIENNKWDAKAKENLAKQKSNIKQEAVNQDSHISAFRKYQNKLDSIHTKAIIDNNKFDRAREASARRASEPLRAKGLSKEDMSLNFAASSFGDNLRRENLGKFNEARRTIENHKGSNAEVRRYISHLRNAENHQKRLNAQIKKGGMLQRGLSDSTRNMVRSYVSVFAAFAATSAINTAGQKMEGVQAGMTAVSKDSREAAESIEFLRNEGRRLGLDIGESSKAFVKLRAAIGDKATIDETRKAFTNLSEAGVVYQLSQDDMAGTIRA